MFVLSDIPCPKTNLAVSSTEFCQSIFDECNISASDNVMVTRVQVTVLDEEGSAMEKMEGIRRNGNWWEVVTNAEGKVLAEAWDLAGNVARMEDG